MNRFNQFRFLRLALLALTLSSSVGTMQAQTTGFTYQGFLSDTGVTATGVYDLQFKLFDAASGGVQQGGTLVLEDVQVTNGIFSVTLDFGASVFSGASRWLQIGVRLGASTGAFTTLSPLQAITSTPYTIKSLSAASADGLSVACVNCVTSSQIANGAVTSALIADGTIVNADISASAAITPSKIAGTAATLGANTFTGAQNITGTVTATSFVGNGAGLTSLPSGPLGFMAGVVNPNNLTPFWTTLSGDSPITTFNPEVGAPMPVACTFSLLTMSLFGVSGTSSTNTISVTLYKNRIATAMSCSATNSTGGVTTCSSTQQVSVAVGDTMSIGYSQTNNTPVVRIGVGTRCQ